MKSGIHLLSVIQQPQRKLGWFIRGAWGYDSNVSIASDDPGVSAPSLQRISFLLPTIRKRSSPTFKLAAGFDAWQPLSEGKRVYGGASVEQVTAYNANDFSTRSADAYLGYSQSFGKAAMSIGLSGQRYALGGSTLRDFAASTAELKYAFGKRTVASGYAQIAMQRFLQARRNDVNSYSFGVAFVHAAKLPASPILFASGFYGESVLEVQLTRHWCVHRPA